MIQSVSPEELQSWDPSEYILIDIRDEESFRQGSLPGAVHITREELESGRAALPAGKKPVIFCMFGGMSLRTAEKLQDGGLSVWHLSGGYGQWLVGQLQQITDVEERRELIEKSLRKRFAKRITSRFVKAISDYELLFPGDRVAVCISGGKDSMLMAKLFQEIRRRNKFSFETVFLCMDPGYSPATLGMIQENARLLGIPLTMFSSRIFDAVDTIPHSPCYICARMRRGYLYSKAKELGCNKIALGHHYDDVIETTLMSILYSGQTQTMMPKLHSMNFEGMELIRPMYLIREDDIKRWRDENDLHFIRCACHFTETIAHEASGDSSSKRIEAKQLIAQLKKTNENVEGNIFRSMENIHLDAVLGYKQGGVRHSFLDDYD